MGADYHFETTFEAAGEIQKKTKTLNGDLVLASTGDPVLTTLDVNRMIQQVIQCRGHQSDGQPRCDRTLHVCVLSNDPTEP